MSWPVRSLLLPVSVYTVSGVSSLQVPGLPGCLAHGLDIGSFPCSPKTSLLAFTCSGTEQPKFSLAFLQVINGNLLFPGIDDREKDAFRRCPVPVSAFAWWLRAAAAAGLAREVVVQTRSAHAVSYLTS